MKICPFCGCDETIRFRLDIHVERDCKGDYVTVEKKSETGQNFCIECAECKTRRVVPMEALMELWDEEWDGTDEGL